MEQWNMVNQTLYDYFFDHFSQERYSLEQAQILSYIEMYSTAHNAVKKFQEDVYHSSKLISAIVKELEEKYLCPSLDEHKRKYRAAINKILSCTLDGLTLDICLDPSTQNTNRRAYELTKADLLFFNFIFVTRNTEDAKQLTKGGYSHYARISEDYFKYLKMGIENLINTHPNKYTPEDVTFCFEYKFGLARQRLLNQLTALNDITTEISNFELKGKEVIAVYDNCETILKECENKLMRLRSSFF